ncbi:MAG: hypothetical protein J5838_08035 [Desulfovibrio sp.]|nr:hypothetical protein [Desulfovibrio sp.]
MEHGILLTQYPIPVDGENLGLVTKLVHADTGHFQPLAVIPLFKHDLQATVSAITYGRRYSISAMLDGLSRIDREAKAHGLSRSAFLLKAAQ